jgi:hypothetical protein
MALNCFLVKSSAYLAIAAASESGLASAAAIMVVGMFAAERKEACNVICQAILPGFCHGICRLVWF